MKKIETDKIKTWFVTGASSGFGHETCKQLLERGYNVIAVSRRVPDFNESNALCLSVDVTDQEQVKNAISKGIEYFGGIDVIFCNAGITENKTLEEQKIESLYNIMQTNFYGTFNVINSILPYLRENKKGTIITMSSQSGITYRAYGTAYCASKHAVEALSSVCWHETRKFCRVMTVEPGFFPQTNVVSNVKRNNISVIEDYKNLKDYHKKIRNHRINDLVLGVKYIIDTVELEKLPRRLMLGEDAINKIQEEIKSIKSDLKYSKKLKFLKKEKFKKFINKILKKG